MYDGYTKLFSSIITSTIWQESKETKLVWITMLAMKDYQGNVPGSIPGLAHIAGVSIEDCQKAIEKLKSPDPYSRTKDFEGRRIEDIEGGWIILNANKYREKRDPATRREQTRKAVQKYRDNAKEDTESCNHNVSQSKPQKAHTYTDITASGNINPQKDCKPKLPSARTVGFCKPTGSEVTDYARGIGYDLDGQSFVDWYESNGWKVGKNAMKDWRAAVRTWKQKHPEKHIRTQEQIDDEKRRELAKYE
jgi:hypothetical protein